MSDNPLIQKKTALDVSPVEEYTQKLELLDKNEISLLHLEQDKAKIARERQELEVDSKLHNLDAVREINQNIDDLMRLVSDPMLALQISRGIETGKDYNEFVKAISAVAKLRDDLLDRTLDENARGKSHKKFITQFQTQGTTVTMGVEIDG